MVAFVIETLSAVTQYYRAIGNIWDTLYTKHQLRDSDITLDRVNVMISEFLIEVQLNEEQDKITQIVIGASKTHVKPKVYNEYVNASKGKIQKGKGKGAEGNQMDATLDITAPSTILVDSLEDAQSVDPRSTTHPNVNTL